MSLWKSSLLLLLSLLSLPCEAQSGTDLYNLENSRKYAEYLFLSRQYVLSAEEYERSLFLAPQDEALRLRLLQSYRKAGKYETGISRLQSLYPSYDSLPAGLALEFGKCLILNGEYDRLGTTLTDTLTLGAGEESHFRLLSQLLQKRYDQASATFGEMQQQLGESDKRSVLYAPVVKDASEVRYRKPWLGMLMSTVVPGTGKFYAGQFADGLTALMVVGLTGFQAYRVLKNEGTNSIFGWGLAAVSFTFYSANIYGSHRAVRRYNERTDRKIRQRTEAVMERAFK